MRKLFYVALASFNRYMKRNEIFIKVIRSNNDSPVNYPVGQLISSMAVSGSADEVFYDYLKYFSGLPTNKDQKATIITNLDFYRDSFSKPLSALSNAEKTMLFEPCLSNRALVPEEAEDALCLLVQNSGLMEIIRFFYKNKLRMKLNMESYEIFSQSPDAVLGNLSKLLKLLGHENMYWLMERWQENNCSVYELESCK